MNATRTRRQWRSLDFDVDGFVEALLDQMCHARREWPGGDYSARIYACQACGTVDGAVAPRDELVDDYPCPACGAPSTPWVKPWP